jgi:hypothetical protein
MAKKKTDGAVEITLDDEKRWLEPSIGAIRLISKQYGGLQQAVRHVTALELDAYIYIVRHGLGLKDSDAKGLDEKVFRSGIVNLQVPLTEYLAVLINGGRPVRDETEAGSGAKPGEEKADS